ncbi:MAG: KH domain-containing protein [Ilumatobacteraceae bacterium]
MGDAATEFLNGLAAAFGIEGTSTATIDGDQIEVTLEGDEVGMLIGQRGATLLAIQDLTRVVAQRQLD